MNAIEDSVHDWVTLSPVAADLLDTPTVQRLEKASGLVGAIRQAQRNHWRLGVYTPEREQEAVVAAAVDVLGLPERVRA